MIVNSSTKDSKVSVDSFKEWTIVTEFVSSCQSIKTIREDDKTICWIDQRDRKRVRHIVPEYRDRFREFLRQWSQAKGSLAPFNG